MRIQEIILNRTIEFVKENCKEPKYLILCNDAKKELIEHIERITKSQLSSLNSYSQLQIVILADSSLFTEKLIDVA